MPCYLSFVVVENNNVFVASSGRCSPEDPSNDVILTTPPDAVSRATLGVAAVTVNHECGALYMPSLGVCGNKRCLCDL